MELVFREQPVVNAEWRTKVRYGNNDFSRTSILLCDEVANLSALTSASTILRLLLAWLVMQSLDRGRGRPFGAFACGDAGDAGVGISST